MPLTLEERERRAYAEGRVDEAAVLAEAIDLTDERIDELEHEVRGLKTDLDVAEEKLAEMESEGA